MGVLQGARCSRNVSGDRGTRVLPANAGVWGCCGWFGCWSLRSFGVAARLLRSVGVLQGVRCSRNVPADRGTRAAARAAPSCRRCWGASDRGTGVARAQSGRRAPSAFAAPPADGALPAKPARGRWNRRGRRGRHPMCRRGDLRRGRGKWRPARCAPCRCAPCRRAPSRVAARPGDSAASAKPAY
ncbi:hypothetical protein ACFPM0_20120 [Pseudonocardia sulfidoxydans]|uniref:hypothetical protein n=1 Tax=Pseudonocardia sulfidoxydans TaxID=54011 RepID=UPI003616F719